MTDPEADQTPEADACPETIAVGEVLAGRYQVVSFIAYGALGNVYEVEDLELHERVALKAMRSELTRDRRVLERFQREIRHARKVTHPSVCRILDLGFHRARGSAAPLTFLTMELLRGETLADRLIRDGPVSLEEALPLIDDMASGLAAAHALGVVHRDFKPGNVVLVPEPEGGVRAVITDLGLAHTRLVGTVADSSLARTGLGLGTPAYMSPEQVEGTAVTPASDIYALGTVMYEMATGAPPFRGDTPLASALQRLDEPAPRPRVPEPGLDQRWESAILRCLARRPADRFRDARDVIRALRGESVAPPRARIVRDTALAAVVAIALVATVVAVVWRRPVGGVKVRPVVAFLGFRNLTGTTDASWLSIALSEMLSMELATSGRLRTLPGEQVAQTTAELGIGDAPDLPSGTLARIHAHAGADFVVLGSYRAVGDASRARIRLDLRVQNTRDGDVPVALTETGKESDLFDLVSRLSERLRSRLRAGELPEGVSLRTAFQVSSEAARRYSEGIAALRADDALRARDLFEKSLEVEPNRPLVSAALAEAWLLLGYDANAREEARKAWEVSGDLPHEDGLRAQARYHEIAGSWDRAADVYRTLWASFPDNPEYGLGLAASRREAGRGREALEILTELRRLPKPAGDDPRIDLEEARDAESLADSQRQLVAARRAARKADAVGARLLAARSRLAEGSALVRLGDPARGHDVYLEARTAFEAAGSRRWAVEATRKMAALAWQQGDMEETRRLWEVALRSFREIGDERGVAASLTSLGLTYAHANDVDRARDVYEEALEAYRRVADKPQVVKTLTTMGDLWVARGEVARARPLYQDALARARALLDREAIATLLENLAVVARIEGELPSARKMYEEALALLEHTGQKPGLASVHRGLGELLAVQGDFAEARRHGEKSLALARELRDAQAEGDSQLALASLCLDEGRAADGETLARETVEAARTHRLAAVEVAGLEVLARALLAQGRAGEARAAAQSALDLEESARSLETRGRVRLTAARVMASVGEPETELRHVHIQLGEARKAGLIALQLDLRLAMGELEIASGHGPLGRARLETLGKEAALLGFVQVANKANLARLPRPASSPRPAPSVGARRRASSNP